MNANGIHSSIKERQVAEWIKKYNVTIGCLQEKHLKRGETHRAKVKGQSRIYYASTDGKKIAGVATLISDKAKVEIDLLKRDKEGNYILPKGTIDNKALSLLNIYTPSGIASKFLEEKLRELQEKIDNKTVLVGHLNLPLCELDKSKLKQERS